MQYESIYKYITHSFLHTYIYAHVATRVLIYTLRKNSKKKYV